MESKLELARMMLPPEVKRLDPWQEEILTSNNPENHVLVHRQGGKSTIIAVKAITIALTEPNSLILMVSQSFRISMELGRKVRESLELYRQARQHEDKEGYEWRLGLITDMKHEFELDNGSRIVSLPPNEETIRGYSKPRLVILDEASRIPDDVYFAIRPMRLASPKWELWMVSTPFGKRGFFYKESLNPTIKKYRHTIADARKIGRFSQQLVNQERKKGEIYFKQEYECEFVSNLQTLFNRKELEEALVEVEPMVALYECLQR